MMPDDQEPRRDHHWHYDQAVEHVTKAAETQLRGAADRHLMMANTQALLAIYRLLQSKDQYQTAPF